jgi:uncharacterized protein
MRMGLTVVIRHIPPEGMPLNGQLSADELSLGFEGVTAAGALEYDLCAEVVSKELLVRGSLRLSVQFVCSRCLAPFRADVRSAAYSFNRRVTDEEETIDLTESVREDIIMALPLKPLCSQGCRGLCPRCGGDLNVQQCSCPTQSGDMRWGSLDDLKLPPESNG